MGFYKVVKQQQEQLSGFHEDMILLKDRVTEASVDASTESHRSAARTPEGGLLGEQLQRGSRLEKGT